MLHDWQGATARLRDCSLGRVIHAAPEMVSTQTPAKEAARAGVGHGTVFVAEHQTCGRGRRDRAWHSIPGRDLMFSVLLRPTAAMQYAPLLNLAAALAVARALGAFPEIADRAAIKWPNDVLIGDRKMCGIICETAGGVSGWQYAVLGIGINCNRVEAELPKLDSPDRPPSTSLRIETGRTVDLPRLLADVLTALDETSGMIACDSGRASLVAAYRARCCTLERQVRIVTDEGDFEGIGAEITPQGALVVQGASERRVFDVGDVVHARLRTREIS